MSKYFDGYASFKYEDMSREKLIAELKEKVRYIGQLKREHSDEIAKTQSSKDKKISDLEAKLSDLQQEQIKEMQEHQEAMELADKTILNLIEDNRASQEWYKMQLAEKEKESLKYFNEYRAWKSKCELLEQDQTKILEINQDKISFAVKTFEVVEIKLDGIKANDLVELEETLCNVMVQKLEKF